MILAYDNISSPIRICILSTDGEIVSETKKTEAHADLLLAINECIAESKNPLSDITKIICINGPGRFTAVRTACVIGNALAQELQIPIVSIPFPDFEQNGFDFKKILNQEGDDTITSDFGAEPRITLMKK